MAGSKPADGPGEKLDDGSNSAINKLVESVGSHVSESDKDTLAELISFGDKWKAEGVKMEKEWWSDHKHCSDWYKRDLFRQRCAKFYQLKETRKEEEEEALKVLFSNELMQGYLLDKYIEEYLYKWILYYPSEMYERIVGASKEVKGYDAVLAYLNEGNMEPGVNINFCNNFMGPEGVRDIADAIKAVGLAPLAKIDLGANCIGDDGAKEIAEVIKTVGLPPGVRISLRLNEIGSDGAKYLAIAIKAVGLPPGVMINLSINEIGPRGAKYLANAIKAVGLPPGVVINLSGNKIGPRGAQEIAEMIKLVGLEPGVEIDLSGNEIGSDGAKYLAEAIKQKGLPVFAIINLKHNNLSPEMREQLLELNKTVEGEIQF